MSITNIINLENIFHDPAHFNFLDVGNIKKIDSIVMSQKKRRPIVNAEG